MDCRLLRAWHGCAAAATWQPAPGRPRRGGGRWRARGLAVRRLLIALQAANPLPDPEAWTEIRDVDQRLRTALEELYGWYRRTEWMIEKTTRDAPLVAAMRAPMEAFAVYLAAARDALMRGRPERGARRRRVSAAIGHALEFDTWRSLVRGHGLSDAEAVELMAGVAAATRC